MDTLDEVTSVHGRFYELSSNYHMLMGNHAEYYRDALRYLGCMDLAAIPPADRADRAFNIGLAAILGKSVYNFGELLAHPILDALAATPRKWLVDLLYAFNAGDIARFQVTAPGCLLSASHWTIVQATGSSIYYVRIFRPNLTSACVRVF